MTSSEKQQPSRKGLSGLVFVGCLMIALAIGLLTGYMAAAVVGGLGVAFIAMAVVRGITGEW